MSEAGARVDRVDRVLMTADTIGGVFGYAVTLARELSSRGVRVHLATMGEPPRAEQRALLASIPGLELHESRFALEWMDDPWEDVTRAAAWLVDLERATLPSIVHLNGYAHGAVAFRAPRVVVAHSCVLSWWRAVHGEDAPERYARYQREVACGLDAADAVIAPTHAMLAVLREHYGPVPHANVIPNGCDPAPPRANANAKERLVLAAGRLWDRAKNVAALAKIARDLPWPVFVAGEAKVDGAPTADLGAACALGWLGPRELDAWMSRAAIFAHPARYEPFGLSPLEAARHGAALVLGDIPSLREVWGDAARYVAPDDEQSLRDVIADLIADDDAREALGRAASERAQSYTAARFADRYLALYRDLAEGRASAGAPSCA